MAGGLRESCQGSQPLFLSVEAISHYSCVCIGGWASRERMMHQCPSQMRQGPSILTSHSWFKRLLDGIWLSFWGATSSIKRKKKRATHTHTQQTTNAPVLIVFKVSSLPPSPVRRPPFKSDDGIHLTKENERIIVFLRKGKTTSQRI